MNLISNLNFERETVENSNFGVFGGLWLGGEKGSKTVFGIDNSYLMFSHHLNKKSHEKQKFPTRNNEKQRFWGVWGPLAEGGVGVKTHFFLRNVFFMCFIYINEKTDEKQKF